MLPTGKVLSEIARNTNLTPIRQATRREGEDVQNAKQHQFVPGALALGSFGENRFQQIFETTLGFFATGATFRKRPRRSDVANPTHDFRIRQFYVDGIGLILSGRMRFQDVGSAKCVHHVQSLV